MLLAFPVRLFNNKGRGLPRKGRGVKSLPLREKRFSGSDGAFGLTPEKPSALADGVITRGHISSTATPHQRRCCTGTAYCARPSCGVPQLHTEGKGVPGLVNSPLSYLPLPVPGAPLRSGLGLLRAQLATRSSSNTN